MIFVDDARFSGGWKTYHEQIKYAEEGGDNDIEEEDEK